MHASELLGLSGYVSHVAAVVDDLTAPQTPHADQIAPGVADALTAFSAAWAPCAEEAVAGELGELGRRIAAAGMALVEGDPSTAGALIGVAGAAPA